MNSAPTLPAFDWRRSWTTSVWPLHEAKVSAVERRSFAPSRRSCIRCSSIAFVYGCHCFKNMLHDRYVTFLWGVHKSSSSILYREVDVQDYKNKKKRIKKYVWLLGLLCLQHAHLRLLLKGVSRWRCVLCMSPIWAVLLDEAGANYAKGAAILLARYSKMIANLVC